MPAGSSAYLIYYDPTNSVGWVNLLDPSSVSGQTITFPGVATGVTFAANTSYVFALAISTQPIPTAAPKPTPTAMPTPTPSASAAPTATPIVGVAGTFPLSIVNNGSPIASANINLYIYGQSPTAPNPFFGVHADGSTYPLANSSVQPIPWNGGNTNTETVYLPPLIGGRVYVVDGTLLKPIFTAGSGGPVAPAPWANDGSQNVYFDDIEYAETSPLNVNFDVSQTDAIGLDLAVSATNGAGTQTIGLKSGAISAFIAALNGLATPSPWDTLANQPKHITNPQHGSPNFFPNANFLDINIMAAWTSYENGNWFELTAASLSSTNYPGALYGTEDTNGNMNFYSTQNITTGTLIGTIGNPMTYATANNTTVTQETFAQNGTFGDFTIADSTYPTLGPAVGNRVSGALNSGVFVPSPLPASPWTSVQPICTGRFISGGAAYQNQFANLLHQVANTYAYVAGAAYGYPYDDLCGTSTDTTSNGITGMTITINP